jgi:hypothetical protein
MIPENGYLIIWADEDGSQGPSHANFKLSSGGESLTLINSDKRLVDTVTFQLQVADMGYARIPNGTGPFIIKSPTFAANNGTVSSNEPQERAAYIQAIPNPANEVVLVNLTPAAQQSSRLRVYDLNGSLILDDEAVSNYRLNVGSWPSGIYLLSWANRNVKIMVQH